MKIIRLVLIPLSFIFCQSGHALHDSSVPYGHHSNEKGAEHLVHANSKKPGKPKPIKPLSPMPPAGAQTTATDLPSSVAPSESFPLSLDKIKSLITDFSLEYSNEPHLMIRLAGILPAACKDHIKISAHEDRAKRIAGFKIESITSQDSLENCIKAHSSDPQKIALSSLNWTSFSAPSKGAKIVLFVSKDNQITEDLGFEVANEEDENIKLWLWEAQNCHGSPDYDFEENLKQIQRAKSAVENLKKAGAFKSFEDAPKELMEKIETAEIRHQRPEMSKIDHLISNALTKEEFNEARRALDALKAKAHPNLSDEIAERYLLLATRQVQTRAGMSYKDYRIALSQAQTDLRKASSLKGISHSTRNDIANHGTYIGLHHLEYLAQRGIYGGPAFAIAQMQMANHIQLSYAGGQCHAMPHYSSGTSAVFTGESIPQMNTRCSYLNYAAQTIKALTDLHRSNVNKHMQAMREEESRRIQEAQAQQLKALNQAALSHVPPHLIQREPTQVPTNGAPSTYGPQQQGSSGFSSGYHSGYNSTVAGIILPPHGPVMPPRMTESTTPYTLGPSFPPFSSNRTAN